MQQAMPEKNAVGFERQTKVLLSNPLGINVN
jgi:hypothetical protein